MPKNSDQSKAVLEIARLQSELAETTAALAEKTKEISSMRDTDPLTGLANRFKLAEKIKGGGKKAVLIADLSRFGTINAVYGTQVADYVIRQAAAILRYNLPNNAALFRFAGDEFIYLFDEPLPKQAEHFAAQILGFATQSSIFYEAIEIRIAFTIGIAYGGGDESLVGCAMIAMQEAKQRFGANHFAVYSPDMETFKKQKSNLYWIPRVRQAIEDESIDAWRQPIVNNATKEIEHYECLARLRDEFGNTIDPYFFLEAAEISGILTAITKTMIAQSFEFFEGKNERFSLNITDSDLQEGYLEEMFNFRLNKHKIAAEQITLEIVETVSGRAMGTHLDQLLRLKRRGFKLAADDFGAEHSNFARLLTIDLDFIKIDGAFVQHVAIDRRSEMIVRNLAEFARTIGAKTVAEFVSSEEIYEKVKNLGVDLSQGFYFGKPEPMIKDRRTQEES